MRASLIYLVGTISDIYLAMLLLRVMLQWVRARFDNPLAHFVVAVTDLFVIPARRVLPSVAGIDAPTLLVLVGLEILVTWVLFTLIGASASFTVFVYMVVLRLAVLVIWIYTIAIVVYALLSFIPNGAYSPVAPPLRALVEPLLRPLRRVIPPIANLDITPWVAVLLLQAIRIALPIWPYLR